MGLFFLCAKCFHLFKMKTDTPHVHRAPGHQQHRVAPPPRAGHLGSQMHEVLPAGALRSLFPFFFFFFFATLLLNLLIKLLKEKLNADF